VDEVLRLVRNYAMTQVMIASVAGLRVEKSEREALDEVEEKRCSGCDVVKPLTEFYRARQHSDGRASRCRDCAVADQKARRARRRAEKQGLVSTVDS
jgi:hypothetical protein